MSIEYFITSMVVILLPGTGVIYTLACGLGKGLRASVYAALGCTLGILPHLGAAILGLAALLHASALAFQMAKILGVTYLIYMAWCVWREDGIFEITENRSSPAIAVIVRNGFLLNILNPKLSLFFLAFLPQFVSMQSANATTQMIVLGGIFMILTFAVFAVYGAFASAMRDHVMTRPNVLKWFRRGFAGAFGLLGLRLALSDK